MIKNLSAIALCVALGGCMASGSGAVPRFASSRMDARIVTSVSTEFDRSAVPHSNRIHTYDAAAVLNVARYDQQSGRLVTPASERLAEYSQRLVGSDFNDFKLAWNEVESGSYSVSRVFQEVGRSLGLTCVSNDGTLLPGVVPTAVRPGETVYFGHVVLSMKVWPAVDGGVSHPARIVGVRIVDRPPGIESELSKAGLDPATVRFVSNPDAGCRLVELRMTTRRY